MISFGSAGKLSFGIYDWILEKEAKLESSKQFIVLGSFLWFSRLTKIRIKALTVEVGK